MAGKLNIQKTISISNKRAGFEYFFLETHTTGIVLTGTEIKSIRMGKANLTDTYCVFFSGELYVRNMNISKYDQGTYLNHDPLRDRKLLLKRKELNKLEEKLKDQGLTIVVTKMFINDQGFCKLDIALAKGKKLYDKRESIKEKDQRRDAERD